MKEKNISRPASISYEEYQKINDVVKMARSTSGANTYYEDDRYKEYRPDTVAKMKIVEDIEASEVVAKQADKSWISKTVDWIGGNWRSGFDDSDMINASKAEGRNSMINAQAMMISEDGKKYFRDPKLLALIEYSRLYNNAKNANIGIDPKISVVSDYNGDKKNNVQLYGSKFTSPLGDSIKKKVLSGEFKPEYPNNLLRGQYYNLGIDDVPDNLKETHAKYAGFLDEYIRVTGNLAPSAAELAGNFGRLAVNTAGIILEGANPFTYFSDTGGVDKSFKMKRKRFNDLTREIGRDIDIKAKATKLNMPDLYDIPKEAEVNGGLSKIDSKLDEMRRVAVKSFNNNIAYINERKADIALRKDDYDEYFRLKKEAGEPLYTVGGTVGGSLGMMTDGVLSMALQFGVERTTGKLLKGKKGAGFLTAAAGLAANVVGNTMARAEETVAEFGGNRKEKIDLLLKGKLKENAETMEQLSDSGLLDLIDKNDPNFYQIKKSIADEVKAKGILSETTRYNLISGLENGIYKATDKNIKQAILDASRGAKEFYRQQYSNLTGDILTQSLALAGLNSRVKTFNRLGKLFSTIAGKGKKAENLINSSSKLIGNANRFFDNKYYKLAKIPVVHAFSAGLESVEEGQQYIGGQRYIHDTQGENDNLFGSLIDGYGSAATGVAAMFGSYTDEKYINKHDLGENQLSGFLVGLLTPLPGAAMKTYSTLKDIKADNRIRKAVNSIVMNRAQSSSVITSSANYVNQAFQGRKKETIAALEELKTKLPQGVTEQDIDDQIKAAKEAFEIMDNKHIVEYVKEKSSYGSEDHQTIVGLIQDHLRMADDGKREAEGQETILKPFYDNPETISSTINDKVENLARAIESVNAESGVEGRPALSKEDAALLTTLIAKRTVAASLIAKANKDLESIKNEEKNGKVLRGAPRLLDENDSIDTSGSTRESKVLPYYTASLNANLSNIEADITAILKKYELTKEAREAFYTDAASTTVKDISEDVVVPMKISMASTAGMAYDKSMANMMSGKKIVNENGKIINKQMELSQYKVLMDELLNEYKSSRKKEEEIDESAEVESKRIEAERVALLERQRIADEERAKQEAHTAKLAAEEEAKKNTKPEAPNTPDELPPPPANLINDGNGNLLPYTPPVVEAPAVEVEAPKIETKVPVVNNDELVDDDFSDIFEEMGIEQSEVDNASTLVEEIVSNEEQSLGTGLQPELVVIEEPAVITGDNGNQVVIIPSIEEAGQELKELEAARKLKELEAAQEEDEDGIVETEEEEPRVQAGFSDDRLIFTKFDGDSIAYEAFFFSRVFNDTDYPGMRNSLIEFMKNGLQAEVASGTTFGTKITRFDGKSHSELTKADVVRLYKRFSNQNTLPAAEFALLDEEWNSLSIEIVINRPNVPSITLYLRTPKTLEGMSSDKFPIDPGKVNQLIKLRNNLIWATFSNIVNDEKVVVVPSITMTPGRIWSNTDPKTKMSIQRSVLDVLGFGLMRNPNDKTDVSELSVFNTDFAVGTGDGRVVSLRDEVVHISENPEKTNTGNPFIIVTRPIDHKRIPIKLNNIRIGAFSSNNSGTEGNSMIDVVLDLILNRKLSTVGSVSIVKSGRKAKIATSSEANPAAVDLGLTPFTLLEALMNIGDKTKNTRDKDFLEGKQLIKDEGLLTVGSDVIDLDRPSAQDIDIIKSFIETQAKIAFSKETMINNNDGELSDRTVSEVLGDLKSLFEYRNIDSLDICAGLSIDKSDLNLSWLGFLVKKGFLMSDTNDQVFYMGTVKVNGVHHTATIAKKDGSQDNLETITDSPVSVKTITPTGTVELVKEAEIKPEEHPTDDKSESGIVKSEEGLFTAKKRGGSGQSAALVDTETIVTKNTPEGPLRANVEHNGRTMNVLEEVEWLKTKLGLRDDEIDVLDQVIALAGDKQAMGMLTKDAVLLYNMAEEGTAYHEGYHRVSLLLMARAERLQIYRIAKAQNPELRDATDNQVEEYLAERFRSYMLANGKTTDFMGIKLAFRKLMNHLRALLGLKRKDINRLFSDINLGIYKNAAVNKDSLVEFNKRYGMGAEKSFSKMNLKTITIDNFYNIIVGLSNSLLTHNGVESAVDAYKISQAAFDGLYDSIVDNMNVLAAKYKAEPLAKYRDRNNMYAEILNNFDEIFVPEIKKNIATMGFSETIDERTLADETIGAEEMKNFVASYEFSRVDSILPEVKVFIATIPELIETAPGVLEPIINEETGFNSFVPFNEAWNKMVYDLGSSTTAEGMRARIYSRKNDPFYAKLASKLDKMPEEFITKFFVSIKTQRHEFITASYRKYLGENMNGFKWRIADISVNENITKLSKIWGQNYLSNEYIYELNEGKYSLRPGINGVSVLRNVIDDFKMLQASAATNSYEQNSKMLIDLLWKVGVDIDQTALDYKFREMADTKNIGLASWISAGSTVDKKNLNSLFNDTLDSIEKNSGVFVNFKKKTRLQTSAIYMNRAVIKELARIQTESHPNSNEVMVSGSDNAKLYAISQHNYVSDRIDMLKNDTQYFDELSRTTYVAGVNGGGSLVMRQLAQEKEAKTSHKLSLKTFVKVYGEEGGDSGSDYFEMSPVEDYMFKMTCTLNNYILFPTMADKKRYYVLSGVDLLNGPNDNISYKLNGKKADKLNGKITFSTSQMLRFEHYLAAEFLTIKDAFKMYSTYADQDIERKMTDGRSWRTKLLSTYHYNIVNEKQADGSTKKVVKSGNGLRFRNFNMVVNGKSLNDLLDEAERLGGVKGLADAIQNIEEELFAGYSAKASSDRHAALAEALRRDSIQNMLEEYVLNEIEYAKEIGIISGKKGLIGLENINLDAEALANSRKNYTDDNMSKYSDGNRNNDYADEAAIINLITKHALNNAISVIEYEKLIAKDSAYHSSNDAFIKRHSTMMSTGDSPRIDFPVGHRLHGKTTFNSIEINDNKMSSPMLDELRNKMSASLANSELDRHGFDRISDLKENINMSQEELINLYEISDIEAKLIQSAKDRVGDSVFGYNNVDETDATAFASEEMYMQLVESVDGASKEAIEIMKKISSSDLSWLDDEDFCEKVANMHLQPLKMIYVGERFSEDGKLAIPTINKMAVFPVWKFLSGGNMSELYDAMKDKDNPVDLALFKSAVKVGNSFAHDYYDKDGKPNQIKNVLRTKQEFRNIRKQMPTDAHTNTEQAIGTQINKMGMSNIEVGREYHSSKFSDGKSMTGRQMIDEWVKCNTELSNRGAAKLSKMFFKDENGSKIIDNKKFYEFLIDAAGSSKMPDDVLEMFETAKTSGKQIYLESFTDREWVESRILSVIGKEVIDITTDGGLFIQQTPFGLASYKVNKHNSELTSEEELRYTSHKAGLLNGGKPLVFSTKDNEMEVIVSINMFNDIIPKYLRSHTRRVKWLKDNNIIGPNAKSGSVGYRIPSQGLSSMANMKIVDVYPAGFDGVITLPSEFTRLTGSDFDIDKLYVARYSYKRTKNDKRYTMDKAASDRIRRQFNSWYDSEGWKDSDSASNTGNATEIPFAILQGKGSAFEYYMDNIYEGDAIYDKSENALYYAGVSVSKYEMDDTIDDKYGKSPDGAIKNRLLSLFIAVLADESNLHESLLPLDTASDKLSNGIVPDIEGTKKVKKDNFALNYVSPSYQSKKRYEYVTGKQGTAVSALNNANHVIAQTIGLKFKATPTLDILGIGDMGRIYDNDGVKITEWLNALISAHVDVAKDSYIMRLNANPFTYNMLFFLLRAGIGESTFYFLSQPILKELAMNIALKTGKYENEDGLSRSQINREEIENIYSVYRSKLKTAKDQAAFDEIVNAESSTKTKHGEHANYVNVNSLRKDKLKQDMNADRNSTQFILNQARALRLFQELSIHADALAGFVSKTQVDTKKYGISFTSMYLYNKNLEEMIKTDGDGLFINLKNALSSSFLLDKMRNSLEIAETISSGHLIKSLPRTREFMNSVANLMGKSYNLNEKSYSRITQGLAAMVKTGFFDKNFDTSYDNLKSMFYGENTMAKRLARINNKIKSDPDYFYLKSNALFNSITYNFGFESSDPDLIVLVDSNANDVETVSKMKAYWGDLLKSSDNELSAFARDLILYEFVTSGDKSGGSYVKLSEDDRREIGLYDFIADKLKEIQLEGFDELGSEEDILEEILLNRLSDNELVPYLALTKEMIGEEQYTKKAIVATSPLIKESLGRYPAIVLGQFQRASKYVRVGDTGKRMPVFPLIVKANHKGSLADVDNRYESTDDVPKTAPAGTRIYVKSGRLIGYQLFDGTKWAPTVLEKNKEILAYRLIGLDVVKSVEKGKEVEKYTPIYAAISRRGITSRGVTINEFNSTRSIVDKNNLPYEFGRSGQLLAELDTMLEDYIIDINRSRPADAKKVASKEVLDGYNAVRQAISRMISPSEMYSAIGKYEPIDGLSYDMNSKYNVEDFFDEDGEGNVDIVDVDMFNVDDIMENMVLDGMTDKEIAVNTVQLLERMISKLSQVPNYESIMIETQTESNATGVISVNKPLISYLEGYLKALNGKPKETIIENNESLKSTENASTEEYKSSAKTIYNKLGGKTESENVRIVSWSDLKDTKEAFIKVYDRVVNVISTRVKNSNEHFGNPFSHDPAGKTQGLIKARTIQEAVERYIEWIISDNQYSDFLSENEEALDLYSINPEQRDWIRNQIKSGELKNIPILYYKELGEPSHATALDYLINKHNLGDKTNSSSIEKRNILEVTPSKSVDRKAKVKASLANRYIGFANDIPGSSTQLYANQINDQSLDLYRDGKIDDATGLVNGKHYSSSDVVFVSIPGKRGDASIRKREQDKTIILAMDAIEQGATILTDNVEYTNNSDYNEGELRLYKNLEVNGYVYSEIVVDGETIGTWEKRPTDIKTINATLAAKNKPTITEEDLNSMFEEDIENMFNCNNI